MRGVHIWRRGPFSLRLPLWPMAWVLVAGLAVAALGGVALTQGSADISPAAILRWLWSGEASQGNALVLETLRAPRILLALACGALLALAGAVTQDLTRNPLADPSLLGVREGATLSIVLVMLLWPALPMVARPFLGLGGGLAAGALIHMLARRASPMRFILTGLALSWVLSSVQVIALSFATTPQLEAALFWLSGQLQVADWPMVGLSALALGGGLSLLLWLAAAQDLEALGPELARGLGAGTPALRQIQLVCAAGFVAVAVSVGGGIGFVGLIAPYFARRFWPRAARCRLIGAALIGSALVLAADTLGRRLFAPVELPAGLVVAFIGAPALLILMRAGAKGAGR